MQKLPISLRYFAGGDYSVRGFAYKSLGPILKDPDGNHGVVGGRHLVAASFEIQKPIYENVSVATFVDLGNALNTFNKFNLNKLAVGTGIGLSYKTPVGAISAYIAKPLKLPTDNYIVKKSYRLHVTFNADL